jgi:hemolysin activation/secretion protein
LSKIAVFSIAIALLGAEINPNFTRAQTPPNLPSPGFPRPAPTPTESPKPVGPSPQEIIPKTPVPIVPTSPSPAGEIPEHITVKEFKIEGSTVFSAAELAKITAPLTNKPISFAELLQVASDITQLYTSRGYVNSGAYIPGDQAFGRENAVVKIAVIEGGVEDIVIQGTQRLDPNYIRSRIALGTGKPLKIDRVIERLQVLQQDPLIKSLATELIAGTKPGSSILQIAVTENPTWNTGMTIANNRTPSIGEIQALFSVNQSNLSGLGDGINLSYGKSEGSNAWDLNYSLPINPRNGTVRLQYSNSNSRVVESPFSVLGINGTSQDISLSYRQPLIQTPTQEFALGVSLNRRESNVVYLRDLNNGIDVGYPSPGADSNGSTRLTAARFFQEYVDKDSQQVFAARSQVSFGINVLNPTINNSSPDAKFLSWRGQAQYVRALAPNSILLARMEGQIADRALVPLEQIGFGGQDTVRGYRQDTLLGDNGLLASVEARFPLWSQPDTQQLLQITPFIDFGWINNKPGNDNPKVNTLASTGVGLRYQMGGNFNAKLDYGIPLIAIEGNKRTGQEKGFYFSLNYNQFF